MLLSVGFSYYANLLIVDLKLAEKGRAHCTAHTSNCLNHFLDQVHGHPTTVLQHRCVNLHRQDRFTLDPVPVLLGRHNSKGSKTLKFLKVRLNMCVGPAEQLMHFQTITPNHLHLVSTKRA